MQVKCCLDPKSTPKNLYAEKKNEKCALARRKKTTPKRENGMPANAQTRLLTHAPLRLQLIHLPSRGKDGVAGQTTDAASTTSDGTELHGRDTTAAALDTASIASPSVVGELLRGGKVECGKC